MYVESTKPSFVVAEIWNSLSYTDGKPSANQDQCRQELMDWVDAVGGPAMAFDFPTKGLLQAGVQGVHPIKPAALPEPSRSRHSSPCTPACSSPLVGKSNAIAGAPTASTQSTSSCRHWSWLGDGLPSV